MLFSTRYTARVTAAAGSASQMLALNLSAMSHPCERVAAIVVSEINDRLSPKNAPPMTTATMKAALPSDTAAISTASGVSATTVPTEVPTASDMKHAATNIPGTTIDDGSSLRASSTVASTDPISLAREANAPARMKIQTM